MQSFPVVESSAETRKKGARPLLPYTAFRYVHNFLSFQHCYTWREREILSNIFTYKRKAGDDKQTHRGDGVAYGRLLEDFQPVFVPYSYTKYLWQLLLDEMKRIKHVLRLYTAELHSSRDSRRMLSLLYVCLL